MANFFKTLQEDIQVNVGSELSTCLCLLNYRFGRLLMLSKGRYGKIVYPLYFVTLLASRFFSLLLGYSFPFGMELGRRVRFQHGLHGIFISIMAAIGDYCIILHHVTIGSNIGARRAAPTAPKIRNQVFIGVGAKIIGNLTVGDGASIGALSLIVNPILINARIRAPQAIIAGTLSL